MQWLRKIASSQWLWFGVLALSFLTLPFALKHFDLTQELTEGIYIATGLAVLWYTIETSGMRREMVAARKARERPEVDHTFGSDHDRLLRSRGRECIRGARIEH